MDTSWSSVHPVAILDATDHQITARWSDSSTRVNDYRSDVTSWKEGLHAPYNQLADPEMFKQVTILDGVFTWKNILVAVDMGSGTVLEPVQFDAFRAYQESIELV